MKIARLASASVFVLWVVVGGATARPTSPADCSGIDVNGDSAFSTVAIPPTGTCKTRTSHGYPIPDSSCTPGAVNPSLTIAVLSRPTFKTKCVRDRADNSSPTDKEKAYGWYQLKHPANNTGGTQTCELDHLVSLEIGGADTRENIWPQCGPKRVTLMKRYFKRKDEVEDFLAIPFRAGKSEIVLDKNTRMTLAEVQRQIATDWTFFLPFADAYYASHPTKSHPSRRKKIKRA